MDKRDFDYHLPEASIAQQPLATRSAGRMLQLKRGTGAVQDRRVTDLPAMLDPDDLVVFNDTRVIAARLYGRKRSGGRVELMVERILDSRRISAKVRANKPLRPGVELTVGDRELVCEARDGELFTLALCGRGSIGELLDAHGHVPLPPYIRRADTPADRRRYQTLWARHDGAVAAPTAGLHFDQPLLAALTRRGVEFGCVTLHVGSGTWQRLRDGDVCKQRLHAERISVCAAVCEQVNAAKARGNRVVAIGTTVVRSLEAAAASGTLVPFAGETELFLKPGDRFHAVDAMLTNFHEPQSSLLMLVCAFAGRDNVLAAYEHARARGYRFLSYGDAMFVGS